MKRDTIILSILLFVLAFHISLQAQTAEEELKKRERVLRDSIIKSNASLPTNGTIPPPAISTETINQTELRKQKEILKRYEAELKVLRAPNPKDLDKYKDFLQQKNTGLLKLFPDLKCGSQFTVKVDGDCEKTIQDSYSYSIQNNLYADGVFHDIRLEEDRLWLDGFLSQAIITELGDISLEKVSLQNPYADFLVKFKPSEKNTEAKKQFWQIAEKIKSNDFTYGKVVKLKLDNTYLARIINYKIDIYQLQRNKLQEETKELKPFWLMQFQPKRNDMTVAFRVVRIEEDKTVTILWKLLTKKNAPSLFFGKNEKMTDLKVRS